MERRLTRIHPEDNDDEEQNVWRPQSELIRKQANQFGEFNLHTPDHESKDDRRRKGWTNDAENDDDADADNAGGTKKQLKRETRRTSGLKYESSIGSKRSEFTRRAA